MLSEERIRQAEKNVKGYMEDSLIWKYRGFRQDKFVEVFKNVTILYQSKMVY